QIEGHERPPGQVAGQQHQHCSARGGENRHRCAVLPGNAIVDESIMFGAIAPKQSPTDEASGRRRLSAPALTNTAAATRMKSSEKRALAFRLPIQDDRDG